MHIFRRFKQQRAEWLDFLAKVARPRKRPPKRKPGPKKEPALWIWKNHIVVAHTKSEARALFKARDGLKRLPIGAQIGKVGVDWGADC